MILVGQWHQMLLIKTEAEHGLYYSFNSIGSGRQLASFLMISVIRGY